MKVEKLPKGALRLVDTGAGCTAYAFSEGEDKPKKLKMVGYSGGIIKGHWYWGDMAIDVAGMSFDQKRYPILEDHMTNKKIAHMGRPIVENGKIEAPDDVVFTDTEESLEFQKLSSSKPPFPFQASIYAKPTNIERLEEGAEAEVNGYKFKGPGHIWRKSIFKEMSVCVFGWDSKTTASAFSKEVMEETECEETTLKLEQKLQEGGEENMPFDINELEKDKTALAKLTALVAEPLKEAFSALLAPITEKLASTEALIQDIQGENVKLRREVEVSKEKGLQVEVHAIWTEKLSSSTLPKRIQEKIRKNVDFNTFVENDVLKKEEFCKAVDEEVKFWEESVQSGGEDVMGGGVSQKEIETQTKLTEENEQNANFLLSLVGQKKKEAA